MKGPENFSFWQKNTFPFDLKRNIECLKKKDFEAEILSRRHLNSASGFDSSLIKT